MKRTLTALALVLTFGLTAHAMSVDDIIELCKAGFEPDRIASIVDATGLDEPLAAEDWVTLKEQGCDEELVDALLAVLVPVEDDDNAYYDDEPVGTYSGGSDVNVYLGANYGYGWNDWRYSGFSMGWYDPYWSIGWTYWDPYWYSTWWGYRPYAYHYAWWGHPWYGYCQPQYYCHSCYDYNWSGSNGSYARYKSSRRGSLKSDNYSYASAKTRTTVESGVMSKVRAKTTLATTILSTGGGLKTKSTTSGVYKSKTSTGGTSTTYTTRKTKSESGLGTTKSGTSIGTPVIVRPKSTTSGSGTKGSSTPATTGTKSKSPSGTANPSPKSDDGGTSKTPAVTTPKTSAPAGTPTKSDSPKARPKESPRSSVYDRSGTTRYTTTHQERVSRVSASRNYRSAPARAAVSKRSASGVRGGSAAQTYGSYAPKSTAPKTSSMRPSSPAPSTSRSFSARSGGHSKAATSSSGHSVARRK